jgi:hypothetical protein
MPLWPAVLGTLESLESFLNVGGDGFVQVVEVELCARFAGS